MRFARRARRRAPGFTLIEVLVVVLIIGILAAIIGPRVIGKTEDARRTRVVADLKSIETALDLYKLDNGVYPTTEQGLQALVTKPSVGNVPANWKDGGYLSRAPSDPWGHPYAYAYPGTRGEYDLFSLGADGQPGGEGANADAYANET